MYGSRFKETTRRCTNCNGVQIELIEILDLNNQSMTWTVVVGDLYDPDAECDEIESDNLEEAQTIFRQHVESYKNKPNMNAQIAYDREHGTINGEDERIAQMRELWRE